MIRFYTKDAENGGYAVGAFNVYNLEGVEAVVSAAEEEKSPAILQVRMRSFIYVCYHYEVSITLMLTKDGK